MTAHSTDHGAEHVAPHFDDSGQQFSAAKLGMWLFLATEILLFGGLFCAYGVLRQTHPSIFAYGSQFLDTRLGILNTTILITSSVTMAIGVTAAQLGRQRLLLMMLALTFLGAAGFMTVKYIEYHHKFHEGLVWGPAFYRAPAWAARAERDRLAATSAGAAPVDDAAPYEPDLENGRGVWTATCASCHGASGEGVTGQGKDVRGVAFVTSRSDDDLLAFLKIGRRADDPANTTGVMMPPRGGNPLLTDHDLLDVIRHVRSFEAGVQSAAPTDLFASHRASLPPAPPGPPGLRPAPPDVEPGPVTFPHHAFDPVRPAKAHLFFAIYFLMTGLHGIHVLVGMGVIGWLFFRAVRREFGPSFVTPVDLGGLYWHIVDLIWIFLFPLFYLIG